MKQIISVKAHGSELGNLVDGMIFTSLKQADLVIFMMIKVHDMGFAKTKLTVTWEDGEQITLDDDFAEGEGALNWFKYQNRFYAGNRPSWLTNKTDEQFKEQAEEWKAFIAEHEIK